MDLNLIFINAIIYNIKLLMLINQAYKNTKVPHRPVCLSM